MADRDVRVNLKLEASGSAPQAMRDVSARAESAAANAGKLNTELGRLSGSKVQSVSRTYEEAAKAADRAAASTKNYAAEQNKIRSVGIQSAAQQPKAAAGGGGGGAGGGGGGGIAEQLGIDPQAAGALGQAYIAIQAVSKGLSAAAKAADAFADETLSSSQKIRKASEGLPVIGELIKSFGELSDAVSGKSEAIRKSAREDALNTAKAAAGLAAYQQQSPLQNQINQNDARAKALKNAGVVEFAPPSTKDTLQGELDFQRYERKAPLLVDENRAKAELAAANQGVTDTAAERSRLEASLKDAEAKSRAAQAVSDSLKAKERTSGAADVTTALVGGPFAFTGNSTLKQGANVLKAGLLGPFGDNIGAGAVGPTPDVAKGSYEDKDKIKAATDAKALLMEEQKLRQQLVTASQAEAEAIKAAAKAESDLRKANIALAKEELAVLKEREQAVKASATSFGSLSAVDKQAALEASAAFAAKGYDALTPEAKAAIQAAGGGQALQKAAEQSALKDSGFAAFQGNLGLESDLKGIQQKALEVQAKVQVDIQVDEQKFSSALVDALNPVLKKLSDTLDKIAAGQVKTVEIGNTIKAASN